jgi:hypothetical protein
MKFLIADQQQVAALLPWYLGGRRFGSTAGE